jgi:hypothetical protein
MQKGKRDDYFNIIAKKLLYNPTALTNEIKGAVT